MKRPRRRLSAMRVPAAVACVVALVLATASGCAARGGAPVVRAEAAVVSPPQPRIVRRTIALIQGTAYQGVTDTSLDSSRPSDRLYYSDEIVLKGAPAPVVGLLKFDDIPVAPAAEITEAFIALTLSSDASGSSASVSAHRLLSDLDFEYASWDFRDASNRLRWGNDAHSGLAAGIDYDSAPSGAASIAGFARGDTVRIDVTSAASAWVKDPCAGHGLALVVGEGTAAFHSSKSPDANRRPRLYVTYRQEIPGR